ncbi:MAG: glycosyltransferase [Chloroflexota bacterium]|nr:glycosyltransferase [Chloroflexota bacterium]
MGLAKSNTAHLPDARWYRNWRFWLGGAVSLALVAWAIWSLDWRQVWRVLGDAHSGWIVLSVVTVLLTIGARVLRWRGLLLPQRFSLMTLLTALLAGQVVNYVVLSQLGILVRAAALDHGSRARALGTVALEKLWDVVMLLGLIAALSVGLTLPDWLKLPARLLTIGATIALLLLLITLLFRTRFSFLTSRFSFVPLLLDGLEGLVRLQTVLWGFLGSLVVWGLGAATNYCVLRAFDLPLSSVVAPTLLLLAALQAGVAVPSLPGSVGVFETICIAVLALFGVGQEAALASGLVLHAVVFVPPLLLGGMLMSRVTHHTSRATPHPTAKSQSTTPNPRPPIPVSVVIPAYNSAGTLPACLRALQNQTVPADQYEVILVDDGSTDGTAEVARDFGIQVISQPNAGQASARNRGAKVAQGDLLLFTDADCAPAPDWIERMAAAFADPDVAGAKGIYRTRQREFVARFVQVEYEDKCDRMRNQETIDFVDTYSAGYRRDLFLSSGGFDASFRIDEDQELSFRLAKAGHRLVLVPEAWVFHSHVHTLGGYARRKFWIGYWKVRVVREHPDKLVRDSHTPQVLKLQMGLAALGGLLIVGGLLSKWLVLAGLAAWAALIVSGLPFLIKLLRRDPPVVWVAPLLLFVRAWSLGLGFLLGLLKMNNESMSNEQ